MSHDELTALPEQITAGETIAYTRTLSDYPASAGWALTLYLAGASVKSEAGVASGDSFVFTLSAAETAALAAGNYQAEERASKDGIVHIAWCGTIQVLANIATATEGSLQSSNEKLLAAVQAVINQRFGVGGTVTDPAESYTIGGRSIQKMKTRELLDLAAQLRRAIRNAANPGRLGPQVRVQFSGTSMETPAPWWGGE